MKKALLYFFAFFAITSLLSAQKEAPKDDWKILGSIQLRTEADGRDFNNTTYMPTYTSMRTRLGIEKTVFNKITFRAVAQDSRMWGFEGSSLNDKKNLDIHEGWAKIDNLFGLPVALTGGRFVLSYGTERFLSGSEWSYIARSFDGIKFRYDNPDFWIDAFATQTNQLMDNSYSTPATTNRPITSWGDSTYGFYGFWSHFNLDKMNTLEVFGYYDRNNVKAKDTVTSDISSIKNRYTAGLSYWFKSGSFLALLEGAYQFGTQYQPFGIADKTKRDIAAYSFGLKVGYKLTDKFTLELNYDAISGNDIKDKTDPNANYKVFDVGYGSSVSFYGRMSMLRAASTYQYLGLNDYFLRLKYDDADLSGYLDIHQFMSQNAPTEDVVYKSTSKNLGQEIDWIMRYNIVKGAQLESGVCAFIPGDFMKSMWAVSTRTTPIKREDPSFWAYLMMRVAL